MSSGWTWPCLGYLRRCRPCCSSDGSSPEANWASLSFCKLNIVLSRPLSTLPHVLGPPQAVFKGFFWWFPMFICWFCVAHSLSPLEQGSFWIFTQNLGEVGGGVWYVSTAKVLAEYVTTLLSNTLVFSPLGISHRLILLLCMAGPSLLTIAFIQLFPNPQDSWPLYSLRWFPLFPTKLLPEATLLQLDWPIKSICQIRVLPLKIVCSALQMELFRFYAPPQPLPIPVLINGTC